eukprot:COSAG02_NODE_27654_length_605_cov_0.798419_2_plen_56_part_01
MMVGGMAVLLQSVCLTVRASTATGPIGCARLHGLILAIVALTMGAEADSHLWVLPT